MCKTWNSVVCLDRQIRELCLCLMLNLCVFIQVREGPRIAVKIASAHDCYTLTKHIKHAQKYKLSGTVFSNIHIFHDVHQYNKTLIDLHYNYFMYFSFSTQSPFPYFWVNLSSPLPKNGTTNLSNRKAKRKETQIKAGTLLVIPQSCPSV